MALSETNTFTVTKNEIIELAFARLGVISEGATLTAYQVNRGSQLLNLMIKSWLAKGFRLWKTGRATLFLDSSTNEYILGTANATKSYVNTTLSSSASSSDSSIEVTSASGLAVGNYIGITQNNNTILWTTISSISSTTIGLDSSLTSDASSGNNVYVYETKLGKVENIINAQLKMNSTTEIPLQLNSRDTYDAEPVKTLQGIPNKIYYNKLLSSGIVRLFPQPSSVNYIVNLTYQEQFYDMTNPTDDFDFPAEWFKALYLNLAVHLYGFYPISDQGQIQLLIAESENALREAASFDDENTSIYFTPATDTNRGDYA